MLISDDDRFKAVLKMIQVTPENYTSLKAEMIISLYEVVAEAEKQLEPKVPDDYKPIS